MPNRISFIVNDAHHRKKPTHEPDTSVPVASFRTSSLFHYTKEIASLKKILEDGLIPNFCSEALLDGVTIGLPMVSFCDIPLSRTHLHNEHYGYYAIGLATEYGESHGINPVFYVASSVLMERILKWPYSQIRIDKFFYNPVCPLYKKMFGEFNGQEIKNYAENEWRYVVPQSRRLRWMKSMDEYLEWRATGVNGRKPNPLHNTDLYSARLRFEVKDINYILVKNEFEVREMVNLILRMNNIGATSTPLSEEDKRYLITRIKSFEMIRRDF